MRGLKPSRWVNFRGGWGDHSGCWSFLRTGGGTAGVEPGHEKRATAVAGEGPGVSREGPPRLGDSGEAVPGATPRDRRVVRGWGFGGNAPTNCDWDKTGA